jgi:hypothetical protein
MKYKYILCHAINLLEGYFIVSRSQERRYVKKVIRGLERPDQVSQHVDNQDEHGRGERTVPSKVGTQLRTHH